MTQPTLAKDALNRVMGGIFWKSGTTITTAIIRAFHKVEGNTGGDTPLAHIGVSMGKEGDAVGETVVGGGSETPVLQIGGRDPSGNKLLYRVNADRSLPISAELASLAALADAMANPTTSRIGAALMIWNGSGWDRLRVASAVKFVDAASAATDITAWDPAAGKKVRVLGWELQADAAVTLTLKTGATAFDKRKLAADGVWSSPPGLGHGWLGGVDENVVISRSGSAAVWGIIYGVEE